MLRIKASTILCLGVLVAFANAYAFDFASYKPEDLDDILAQPKPKTGATMSDPRKVNFTVTLESSAEEGCGLAAFLKFSMSILPTVYPKVLLDTLSRSKCIKVKSAKGSIITVAIQDQVAEFLPAEVPLGSRLQVYCLWIATTTDGPAILVSEFQQSE